MDQKEKRRGVSMCVRLLFFNVRLLVFPTCTRKSLFLPWNIKGNCEFISEFRLFLVIVNVQYLTILIKS